jgi:hypothetical protein
LIAFLSGCSDSNIPNSYHASLSGHSLNISKNQLSFNSNGGVEKVTVHANKVAWRFTGVPEWLMVNPSSGSTTTSVAFTASENLSADTARTAVFYLESADAGWSFRTMVSVNQQAATSYITPATTSLSFKGGGGSQTINISSNVLWKATPSASWAKAETATDGKTLTISVEENPSDASRTAIVTLSSASGITSSVNITQEPAGVSGSTETLVFEKEGGSKSISITADAAWEVKTSDSWISVTPSSGNAGSQMLSITVLENNSTLERTGYVYVNISGFSKLQIPVVQKGLFIEAKPSSLTFSADADSKQLEINSNTDWSITSIPEWLTANSLSGKNNQTITLTAQNNSSASSRNGKVKIEKEGLTLSAVVDVLQEGLSLSVDYSSLQFGANTSTQNITINTIGGWLASSSEGWITLSQTSGTGRSTISVTVEENNAETSRNGSVRIVAGELSQTITITQQGKYFNITETDKTFTSKGGTLQISFSTNDSWTASLSDNASWLTLSSTSGSGDAMINLTASDNASMKSRECVLTITPSIGQGAKIKIKQDGRYLTVNTQSLKFDKSGGTSEAVTISTDGTIAISENMSWITIEQMSDFQFVVKADPNDDSGRNGVIVISMTGLSNDETYSINISIEQEGNDLSGSVNGHAYVDMGLPSGTLWARDNIGANNSTETGIEFQWGGVKGGDEGNPGGDWKSSIQSSEKDAATVLWGRRWCIPSEAQFDELLSNCSIEQIKKNGVQGFKVRSRNNNNTIFLPSVNQFRAFYWTSDPSKYKDVGFATEVMIEDISIEIRYGFYNGNTMSKNPIRPVVK